MAKELSRTRLWIKLLILLIFVGGLVSFFALGGDQWITLEALKARRTWLLGYAEHHYALMLLISVLVYASFIMLSIPGAIILSLAMGFIFGRWVGALMIICAATLGATLVFMAARYLFAEAARKRIEGGLAKKLMAGFNQNAFNYMLFLRIVPLFPFWLVNLASAFTPIKLRTYVLATALGIVPGSFVFANLGQSLGHINNLSELLSWEIIGALLLLGILALIPILIKKVRSKKPEAKSLHNSV